MIKILKYKRISVVVRSVETTSICTLRYIYFDSSTRCSGNALVNGLLNAKSDIDDKQKVATEPLVFEAVDFLEESCAKFV